MRSWYTTTEAGSPQTMASSSDTNRPSVHLRKRYCCTASTHPVASAAQLMYLTGFTKHSLHLWSGCVRLGLDA